jgi:pSer/pThr/pTyr-binding forkhead associated (FHA) protein
MPGKFKLIINSGPDQGTEIPLEKSEISIGRDVKNDIVINDPEVSRHHARLVLKTNTYAIEDNGSTNGTFINNQRLTSPYPLKPGELIFLGDNVSLAFQSTFTDATVATGIKKSGTKPNKAAVVPPPPPVPVQQVPVTPPVENAFNPADVAWVPVGPSDIVPPTKRKLPRWVWIVIIAVLVILLICVIPLIIIDATNSWCPLFGDILHGINPAVCIP